MGDRAPCLACDGRDLGICASGLEQHNASRLAQAMEDQPPLAEGRLGRAVHGPLPAGYKAG